MARTPSRLEGQGRSQPLKVLCPPHEGVERCLSVLLVAAIVGGLYFLDAHPVSGLVDSGGLTAVLYLPLVVADMWNWFEDKLVRKGAA